MKRPAAAQQRATDARIRNGLAQSIRIACAAVASGFPAGTALAQSQAETEANTSATPVEEIIVTGQRQSIVSAQAIKRDAAQVVDSITAVDIGALPDRSLSEALQRVPGVQLERTNENSDPARLAAEGGGVFVRGLRWVRTELNGRDIFSANGGRTLGFEDVSADLLAGVDVYKTPTADQIEGGLGGTVNLRTRLPLEQDERLLAVSMDYNYADLYDEGFVSGSALYSDRWQLGNGELGVLLSASIAEIGNRTDAIQAGRYDDQDDAGTTVYLPNGIGHRRVDWQQERDSYSAAVQWAPSDELTLTLQTFHAEANPQDMERNLRINGPGLSGLAPWNGDYQYDANNVVESGVINGSSLDLNSRFGSRESSISDYSLGFEYFPNGRWAFSGDLQSIESEAQILSMSAFTQLGGFVPGPDTTFDFTGSDPFISVAAQDRVAQADEYWWAAAMDHLEDNRAESLAGRLDAEYTFENNDFLQSFRFGVRVTDKDAVTRQTGWNWSILSAQYWSNVNPVFLDDGAVGQSELYAFDDFMRGDVALPSVGWFPVESLLHSPTGAFVHFEPMVWPNNNNNAFFGWAPLSVPEAYDVNPRGDNVSAGLNDQNEKTQAIYASVHFGGDIVDGNVGVRAVKTETTALGRSTAGGISADCDTTPSADCAGAQAFVDAFNAELSDFRSFTNSYTNVLPVLNLRVKLQEDLQLRFGLSRGLVRPSFSQIRPSTILAFDFQGNQFDPNIDVQGTVRTGSPDLEPTLANQFDTSIEWYFDEAGSLTFAAFYKDISDYVALVTQVEEFTFGGQTYEFDTTRQVNAESGKLKGFELAYQQFYDMLPSPFDGLGVQVNYTHIDNTGGANPQPNPFGGNAVDPEAQARIAALPIEGMSDSSYNVVLMYEKYDISARLAYNWRERYLLTTNAANINRPMWFDDHGRLDGSLFYHVTDNLNIGLQFSNILNSRTELEVLADNGQPAHYSWTDTDRRFAFVTRYRF